VSVPDTVIAPLLLTTSLTEPDKVVIATLLSVSVPPIEPVLETCTRDRGAAERAAVGRAARRLRQQAGNRAGRVVVERPVL
jgi:hypothetical protein